MKSKGEKKVDLNLLKLSLILSILVCILKFYSYLITNSLSVLSDALESIINVIAAIADLFILKISKKPPDKSHPYGHTKAEYLSSVLEASFILLAMLLVIKEAIEKLINKAPIENITQGTLFLSATVIINSTLAILLIKHGKSKNSQILKTHGYHILSDALTTLGVLIGIIIIRKTGKVILDPIIAIILALYASLHAFKIIKESTDSLIDRKLDEDKLRDIEDIINETLKEMSKNREFRYHNLRSRKAGTKCFIDLHINVPDDMTVKDAHKICEKIESNIKRRHPDTDVLVHIDPDNVRD